MIIFILYSLTTKRRRVKGIDFFPPRTLFLNINNIINYIFNDQTVSVKKSTILFSSSYPTQ